MSCALARGLGFPADAITYDLALGPLVSDATPTDPAALATRLANALASELPGSPRLLDGELSRVAAQARGRHPYLLVVTPRLEAGRLRVAADLYPTPRGFWARLRASDTAPLAHASADAPLDAELAAFFPPIPLVAMTETRVPSPVAEPVALACGDLDGLPGLELAVVGRSELAVGRVRAGVFVKLAETSWAALGSPAPTPLRSPIATAVALDDAFDSRRDGGKPGPVLALGLTDRASGVWLDASLALDHAVAGVLPWPGGGCAVRAPLGLESRVSTCERPDVPTRLPGASRRGAARRDGRAEAGNAAVASAVAGARLVDRDGVPLVLRAALLGQGSAATWTLTRSEERAAGVEGVPEAARGTEPMVDGEPSRAVATPGAATETPPLAPMLLAGGYALALGDLDLDGVPDVVASRNTLEPSEDRLTVYRLVPGATEAELIEERPAPGGVTAIALCPQERTAARASWVAAVGDELWILQAP